MQTMTETMQILGAMMTPAGMITACSLLLLGVYDKYSKIVASIRSLNSEQRHLHDGAGLDTHLHGQDHRERQIGEEIQLLRDRLGVVLGQVQSIVAAMAAFIFSALLIGAGLAFHINMGIPVALVITAGFVLLLAAMVRTLREIHLISDVVSSELIRKPVLENRNAPTHRLHLK